MSPEAEIPGFPARPLREIRAVFDDDVVRVYQAYSPAIAEAALAAGAFVTPFSFSRMTWIKPSFTWMMYRCGWARKPGQEYVLGIDITRAGFEWALGHACLSHFDPALHSHQGEWEARLKESPVRIQWDPERSIDLQPLPWRSLQVGLGPEASRLYAGSWLVRIEDVTPLARRTEERLRTGDRPGAEALLPLERPYPLPEILARRIGMAMPLPPEQSPASPSDFGNPGELMEAALREPDPIAALRAIAVKMSESGLGKKAISGIFLEHYAKLKEQERTREEDILGDVIDMVADTYPPNNLNLPG